MLCLQTNRPRSGVEVRRRGLMKPIPTKGIISMSRKVMRNRRKRNHYDLPLFAWADARQRAGRPRQRAIKYVQKFGVSNPSTAALIAELAGLRTEDE